MALEIWKDVVSYDGKYQVSSLGNVRKASGQLMNQHDNDGYQLVFLIKKGTKSCGKYVHRLMLEAFVGLCPDGYESCHDNGIRFDNKIENLRWDTKESNWEDKRKHGTAFCGPTHPNSKFSYGCIERIRDMNACGVPSKDIASWFDVCTEHINLVLRRRRWGAMSW